VIAPELATIALSTAHTAWPDVALADAVFLDHVEHCAGDGLGPDLDFAAIYLGCACIHGDPRALAAFEAAYLAEMPRWLARITRDPALIDELVQQLRIKLFVGDRPAITRYLRGSLGAWLRVVASRLAIDLLRQREQPVADPELELASLAGGDASTDHALLQAEYRAPVEAAFAAALAALDPIDRSMLRLCFVDGVGLDGIGRIYQLSKSAVSRRLARCRAMVLADVKQRLGSSLGIAPAELHSLLRQVQTTLHLSLSRLLASRPAL
jgi:RNA polymerase sigma-70 factor (ECF subfamily)